MVMPAASYERRLTGWIKSLNGLCRIAQFNRDEPCARWPERLARMVAFRRAELTDVDAVLAFWAESAEDTARPVDTSAAVEHLIARDPDALLLAVDDGKIVGSIIAGWDGWRCHLYRLAVDPRRRGEGLGRALIDAAEERLTTLGGTRLDAVILDGNELAHRAWTAAGFSRQAQWSRWVKPVD
jgi:ribosomal protein S18 acetylase RimI-like enzyme